MNEVNWRGGCRFVHRRDWAASAAAAGRDA